MNISFKMLMRRSSIYPGLYIGQRFKYVVQSCCFETMFTDLYHMSTSFVCCLQYISTWNQLPDLLSK